MKRGAWKKKIVHDMTEVGTYKDSFVSAIDTLADILERRDMAMKQWKDEGCEVTVIKISDRGARNVAKNPLVSIIQECEKDALTYWTQLGLTPGGLKKTFVADRETAEKSVKGLGEILRSIANEND